LLDKREHTLEKKINKDGSPSIKSTRQMRTQVDTTQRKNKSKQSTKKQVKIIWKEDSWGRDLVGAQFGKIWLYLDLGTTCWELRLMYRTIDSMQKPKRKNHFSRGDNSQVHLRVFNSPCVYVWHVRVRRSHMETSLPSPSSSNFLTTRVPSIEEGLWLMTTVGQFLLLKRTFAPGSNFFLKLWKNVWF
jgi:hypothetical protein